MRERERDRERNRGNGDDPAAGADGGSLARLRDAGADFLRAGDEAISRALSGDSEAFLAAGRQQGGE